jgi:hypothetical protein
MRERPVHEHAREDRLLLLVTQTWKNTFNPVTASDK